jgi:hypothetical protein
MARLTTMLIRDHGRIRNSFILAIAVIACLPRSTQAQDSAPELPATSVKLRAGPFEAAPSVLTSNGFDTNITRVGGIVPISSYEFFTIPQLDAKYKAPSFTISGTAAAEIAYTPGEVTASKKSNFNNFGEVSLKWARTILRPSFLVWRRNTYARPDFEIGLKSQRIARTIDAGLEWVPGGRLRVAGGFVEDRTRYDADAVFAGVKLAEKLNFDVYTPHVSATFKVTPMLELGGGVDLTRERFLLAPDRNGDGSRIFGVAAFATPTRLFGSVSLGLRRFTPVTTPDATFNGTFARGAVGYQYGRTNLLTTLNRDIGFSYDSGRGFFVASTVLANLRRELPRRFDLEFEGSVQKLVYHPVDVGQVPVRDMLRFDALGALAFSIKPSLKIGGNIEREAARGAEVWNAWRFTFYTTYGTNRFRKLDRPLPR